MFQPKNPEVFNPLVWQIARMIPAGKVSSYGQIASMIPPPHDYDPLRYVHVRARWVGTAMRILPNGTDVPWQRVVNSRGFISNLPYPDGRDEQRFRLEGEGILFDENGKIDLKQFGWTGPPETWLEERGLFKPKLLK